MVARCRKDRKRSLSGKVKREVPRAVAEPPAYSAPMNCTPARVATTLLVLLAAEASATELVALEWTTDGRFAREMTVPATKFVEVCGALAASAKVRWQFDASAPLNFNIHYHEGKKVLYPAKRDQVAKAADVLNVEVAQTYCWMWTNKTSAEATLKLELRKD